MFPSSSFFNLTVFCVSQLQDSLRYINNEIGFRALVDAEEGGLPVRFNLGPQFKDYIINAEFRMRVVAVVGDDLDRVWSDVEYLTLIDLRSQPFAVDMNDLAGLTHLKGLSLFDCQVENMPAVGTLTNLEYFELRSVGDVHDISAFSRLMLLT